LAHHRDQRGQQRHVAPREQQSGQQRRHGESRRGTIAKGNFSEGTTTSAGFGALTLSANSTLDFGSGSVGILSFASFDPRRILARDQQLVRCADTIGSGSTDRLIFNGSLSTTDLASFSFTGYGDGATQFRIGTTQFYEVVPDDSSAQSQHLRSRGAGTTRIGFQQRGRLKRLLSRRNSQP
jgi:hypothetical protein